LRRCPVTYWYASHRSLHSLCGTAGLHFCINLAAALQGVCYASLSLAACHDFAAWSVVSPPRLWRQPRLASQPQHQASLPPPLTGQPLLLLVPQSQAPLPPPTACAAVTAASALTSLQARLWRRRVLHLHPAQVPLLPPLFPSTAGASCLAC
jgi:hypothetical protein